MIRRSGNRRKAITFRPIKPTKALSDDLARLYMRVVSAWQQIALGRLLDIYAATLAQMTKDSPQDVQGELDLGEETIRRLLVSIFPDLRRWGVVVEEWHRNRFSGAALTATGIDLATVLSPVDVTETVGAVIARNVALIKDVSAEAQGRISDIVFRGITQRTPSRKVAKELREAVAMSRRRSLLIATDQANKLTASLDRARQEEVGIDQFLWRHSGKVHYRPAHKARDGNVYDWAAPPADLPGQLPFCGCRAQAYISFDDGTDSPSA
ncbi:MAG: hypothetical protein GC201_01045 [Alphaproteobacteria bacterium]|nr:hypothetical protein [Alphaproteobacteria bacterium]